MMGPPTLRQPAPLKGPPTLLPIGCGGPGLCNGVCDGTCLGPPKPPPVVRPPAPPPRPEAPTYLGTPLAYVPRLGDDWCRMLRRAGWPTTVVTLDFETYQEPGYSMHGANGLSTIEYVTDPRFELLGCGVAVVSQPFAAPQPHFHFADDTWPAMLKHLREEYGPNLERCTVHAQNAAFDLTILAVRYGIHPPNVIDLLGLARHVNARAKNDLASLAKRYGLPPKGDTAAVTGKRLRDMTPEDRAALAEYGRGDVDLEWTLFTILAPMLSRPEVEAPLMAHTLGLFTRPSLVVRWEKANELAGLMEREMNRALEEAGGLTKDQVSGDKSFGAILALALDEAGDTVENYQKTTAKGNVKLAIAKADDGLERLKAHQSEQVRRLIAARSAVKSWPLHIARVGRIAAQAGACGGLLPVSLKYHGAHTGRWAGGEKINPQNLPSRGNDLVNRIRNLLEAPPGHELAIVDASQIEARITDWLAGEDVSVWADPTRDPYCEFASEVVGSPVRKKRKTDPPPVAAWCDRMRGMGKVGVLGCGFGMGWLKAQAYAENSYGLTITEEEAQKLVDTYRRTHKNVCRFWRVVEQKFRAAARYGEASSMDRGLRFYRADERTTVIVLPSGRELRYHDVKVSIIDGREQLWMPDPIKKTRDYIWGGVLTENIVQAVARDILGEGILATEAEGFRVALHTHDEIVSVVPAGEGKRAVEVIGRILSTPPAWGEGLPLAAEGTVSPMYCK